MGAETFKERGRLIVVPVGGYIDYDSVMGWASYPAEENVMAVDEFPELQQKITNFLADLCSGLQCSEHMTGNGQDYHGCQDRTRDGLTCQKWSEQYPHSHSFIVDWYPDAHLGDHNFCRNPRWRVQADVPRDFLAAGSCVRLHRSLSGRSSYRWPRD